MGAESCAGAEPGAPVDGEAVEGEPDEGAGEADDAGGVAGAGAGAGAGGGAEGGAVELRRGRRVRGST